MARLITSQHYLNEEIVAEKLTARDFAIVVSPVFEIDGEAFQMVLDGHHSLAAAVEAGAEPEISVADATDHDAIGWLDQGNVEGFLDVMHKGDDYIDAIDRSPVW